MSNKALKTRIPNLGAVVLCGGKSTRLGIDKTQLVFQGKTFLEQVTERVGQVCSRVVLVGDIDFSFHDLPLGIEIDRDKAANKGPLEGMRVGLERLSWDVEFGFVTSCDVPLLKPELITHLFKMLGKHPAVVPIQDDRVYGMTAIYRTELHSKIEKRVEAGQLRVSELAETFDALQLSIEKLRIVDSELDSITNVNSKSDYMALLDRFGLECPEHLIDAIKSAGPESEA